MKRYTLAVARIINADIDGLNLSNNNVELSYDHPAVREYMSTLREKCLLDAEYLGLKDIRLYFVLPSFENTNTEDAFSRSIDSAEPEPKYLLYCYFGRVVVVANVFSDDSIRVEEPRY